MKKIVLLFALVLGLNAKNFTDVESALEKEDYKTAFTILKSLKKNQDKDVFFELARLYDYGCWVRQNISEAIKYYKKSAVLGHIEAQYNLGLIYYLGEEGLKDTVNEEGKPTTCSKHMSEKDDIKPSLVEVKADDKEALFWFSKASKEGFSEAKHSIELICDSNPEVCKQN